MMLKLIALTLLQNAIAGKLISMDLQVKQKKPQVSHNLPQSLLMELSKDQADVTLDLTDYQSCQIFTNILIGSQRKPFQMIFDSGSNWVWVDDTKCTNCPDRPKFSSEESTTYHQASVGSKYLTYGTGSIQGVNGFDTICLTDHNCVDNFSFIDVRSQYGLDSIFSSGLVGLSPKQQQIGADLFILKMKNAGAIDKAVFSIYMDLENDKSKISFGGYDLKNFATGQISWNNINTYSPYWAVSMDSLEYVLNGKTSFITGSQGLIVDTGTSYNLFPASSVINFIESLQKDIGMTCQTDLPITCTATRAQAEMVPDLRYIIGGKTFFLPKESYFDEYSTGNYEVRLMYTHMNVWILGLNFFENYYTIFDQENKKVGFAPSINAVGSLKSLIAQAEITDEKRKNDKFIFYGIFIVSTIILISCVCFYHRRDKMNQNRYEELQGQNSAAEILF